MSSASPGLLDEALRKSHERLQLLADTSSSLLLTDEPREILKGIFGKLSAHLGLEIYFHYEVTDARARLHLDSSAGISEEAARDIEWLEFGTAVCGRVAGTRCRAVLEEVQTSTVPEAALIRSLGVSAYACFPLMAGGHLVGTLSFGSRRRSSFQPDELTLMQTVAGQVAVAVERKRAHDELQQHTASLRERAHILDYAPVFIRDMESTIVFWNKGAEAMYGWTPEGAIGKSSHELLHTEFPRSLREIEQHVLREGSWRGELVHTRQDQTRLVVASHWVLHRDEDGRPAAILEVNNDITELRRAEASLRESEFRYRMLSEAMPVIVFTTGPEGRCDYSNQRWYDYSGFTPEQTLGYGWATAVCPEDLPGATARWKEGLEAGKLFEIQTRFRRADGAFRWFLCRILPLRDSGGRIVKWIGTCMDIEDHRRVEEAVQRAQRSESIGVLAGGVAHQFNNLLTGILGGVSFVLEDLPEQDPSADILRGVLSSSQRAAELTAQLLAYAGKGQFVIEPLDVTDAVQDLAPLLQTAVPRKVALELQLSRTLPKVAADAGQLRQLIMSLVMNGAEAIGENAGTVRIGTGLERLEEPLSGEGVTGELSPGTYVCLEVEDSGCGMDKPTLSRIFDPFFTTKFMGRGLGLAAVLGIVRGHRGAIRIRTAPGEGSTFTVLLPPAPVKPVRLAPAPAVAADAARTILVVDDEEIVRHTARAILERSGFRVLLASSGPEAVSLFEKTADEVAAVVLDLAMPAMGGEETLRHLRRIRTDVPVLVASGFNEGEVSRRFAGQDVTGFVQKPYTSRQLASQVRDVLAG